MIETKNQRNRLWVWITKYRYITSIIADEQQYVMLIAVLGAVVCIVMGFQLKILDGSPR